ncbi:general secretion pathway protein E [Litorivivens lipolytica]|uniref:General secretion pathway protein E n=1 Tax=Litorivivens lipolytica TaxID=1524264 RepID=A0A7W4W5Q5_9GAMM|nr:GspE/PulE family protein [Litorivivens lipolytica]MBB3047322.1 general secretion pathway protein E [Litorivivens lipolytica]
MQNMASTLSGPLSVKDLLNRLEQEGYISTADFRRIPHFTSKREGKPVHPVEHIANFDLENLKRPGRRLTEEFLMQWLAEHCGLEFRHIDPLKIDVPAVTEVMSFAFAQRYNILALEVTDEEVVVAVLDPFERKWEDNLAPTLRKPIRKVLAKPSDIARYTVEFYTLSNSVMGVQGAEKKDSGVTNLEQLLQMGGGKDLDANDGHVVKIVDWLLQYAFDQRASDIHIEPRRDIGNVRFRIDGALYNVYEMPSSVMAAVVSRLKILGRMDLAEKRRPQDGRLKTKNPQGGEIELRLSTLPTAFGEKLVMRIFDPEVLLRSFDQLGLRGEDLKRWQSMISQPNGIVLVTGPTGSGKTTTLYSSLKQIATSDVNVCTIEDPIEMVEGSFNQMQVHSQIGLTFAAGVRALLRQDPDIIMIGEIRDRETAEMAVQAALTGHLVIATLHTNDAPSAITRLLELDVPAYLLKATVLGVMAQRLVRTLCPHCKQPEETDPLGWQQLIAPWRAENPKQVHRADGCLECRNTGFYGRQGIYEVLTMGDGVKDMINADMNLAGLRQAAVKGGMKTLRLSGAQKVAAGETTIAEVMRVAPSPQSN